MDRAVLDAYGWTDIPTDCDFLLDYEVDEATWGRKKKPYRYRWPDAVRVQGARPPPRPQRRTRRRGSPLGCNNRRIPQGLGRRDLHNPDTAERRPRAPPSW